MTLTDCIEFIRKTPNGFMATIDAGLPHVRPMTVWNADLTGFYFYTSTIKPFFSQLQVCAKVEIAFHRPGKSQGEDVILRIAGEVEIVEDMDVRCKLYETMPWLKNIGCGTPDCPTIVVFRIASGKFNFWTWENNVNPGPWMVFP
jgi:uncharacterized pyridoxamine 5'-phosphate oxidase family protein